MLITRNEEEGTFILFPVSQLDIGFNRTVTALGRPGNRIQFLGRTQDGLGALFKVRGVVIPLTGTDKDDTFQISQIIRICRSAHGGTGGLIFVSQDTQDGKPCIVLTGAYCKECNRNMIDVESCHARMCAVCRVKVPALAK